jgi:hypothetical protein
MSVDLAIDLLLPFELQRTQPVLFPGRMAPATALCFLLSGFGLLLEGRPLLPQIFASSALFISLMAFVGYLFDVSALYSVGLYSSMAIHTAIALILFNTGLLVIPERSEFVELLTSDTAGGEVEACSPVSRWSFSASEVLCWSEKGWATTTSGSAWP